MQRSRYSAPSKFTRAKELLSIPEDDDPYSLPIIENEDSESLNWIQASGKNSVIRRMLTKHNDPIFPRFVQETSEFTYRGPKEVNRRDRKGELPCCCLFMFVLLVMMIVLYVQLFLTMPRKTGPSSPFYV